MKSTALKMLVLPALLAFGCDDTGKTTDMGQDLTMAPTTDLTMSPDLTPPAPPAAPTIGTQIDRFGRPAINTALTDPFDLTAAGTDATKDAYNKDSNPAMWVADWQAGLTTNLAIFDGADTVCGNQLAADMTKTDKTRYATLSSVLADDRMWLNTASTTCNLYLGVEANALGITNTDCGGRTLLEDVIDESYTALTVGPSGFMANGTFAVTDGVSMDADGVPTPTFPYLAPAD